MDGDERAIGKLEGRLGALETTFGTHRQEMREDIKTGFKDLNSTLNGKLSEISGQFNQRIEACNHTHDTQIRQAHGRIKGVDDKVEKQAKRIGKVEHGQGKLVNWKYWVVGGLFTAAFLFITLPPAIRNIIELYKSIWG